jgi:hypothetical protein
MDKNMKQVKFTIESGIVDNFKARCSSEGVSMASVIGRWMKSCPPSKEPKVRLLERKQRRKAVGEIIGMLEAILDAESGYRDNIPEQFEQRHEVADHACEQLEEAISSLLEAYD